MIEIQPKIDFRTDCLNCKSADVTIVRLVFQGIHILADCSCNSCKMDFYSTLPIAHNLDFPVKFDKEGNLTKYDKRAQVWHAKPLIESVIQNVTVEAVIKQNVISKSSSVVILNCIDGCFGHVYLRLWNTQNIKQKHQDKGLIVLLPKNMVWLVPEEVDEIWTVDAPLNKLTGFIVGLDEFIMQQLPRFNYVFLSHSYPHLENKEIDLSAFVKQERFDLSDFKRLTSKITFVLREDRYWHRYPIELFLFKVFVKFKALSYLKWFFIYRQNQLVSHLAKLIKREINDAKLYAVGLGRTGNLYSGIIDKRLDKITVATEKEWCEIYAESQIVIGIHGSHMLIPTSLSAGFIELLPRYKIPHLAQDIATQYTNRYSHFLCRYLDLYSPLKLVAQHATSMLKDFPKW